MIIKNYIYRFIFVCCFLTATNLVYADDAVSYLFITLTDNTQTCFALNDNPVITINNGTFLARCGSENISTDLASVKKYYFSTTSGIENKINSNTNLAFSSDQLIVSNGKVGDTVRIIAIDGSLIASDIIPSTGNLTIDLSSINQGVYIVCTPTAKLKIMITHK